MKGRVGLVLVAVGVVALAVGIPGVVSFAGRVHTALDAPSRDVPAEFTVHMTPGKWEIYDLTGYSHSASLGPVTANGGTVFPPVPVAVTASGPHGETVRVTPRSSGVTLSLTEGSDTYRAVAQIDVRASGTYTFNVETTGGQRTSVVVGPNPVSGVVAAVLWGVLAFFGFLVAVLGLILFLVRRRSPPKFTGYGPTGFGPPTGFGAAPAGFGPPAPWMPPGQGPPVPRGPGAWVPPGQGPRVPPGPVPPGPPPAWAPPGSGP